MDKDLLEFLQAFREEITGRLDGVDQRFNGMDQRFNGRFDEMEKRLDARIDTLRNATNQRLDALGTETRGAYVLIEDLHGKVQLVAEGVAGVAEQLQSHKEEMAKRFDNLESFYRRSYQDLNTRVRRLEAI